MINLQSIGGRQAFGNDRTDMDGDRCRNEQCREYGQPISCEESTVGHDGGSCGDEQEPEMVNQG